MGKNLWTDGTEGEPISIYTAFNELDEARFVVGKIKSWLQASNALSDSAVLYRNNAQSRVLEEALLQEGLKYRIYGGMRFFERQEIKDALCYLRIVNNRNDDALLRSSTRQPVALAIKPLVIFAIVLVMSPFLCGTLPRLWWHKSI